MGTGLGVDDVFTVFFWFAGAAALALLGFYLALALRRWAQRDQRVETFTFQDLRDMRARGQISEREFAAVRAALLARHQPGSLGEEPPADPGAAPPGDPSAPADGPTPPEDGH